MKSGRALKQKPSAEFVRSLRAAKWICGKTRLRPRIGVVLGSGLGAFAQQLTAASRMEYRAIPHFPRTTAIGHPGRMVIGKVSGVPVAALQGRVHLYEGYSPQEVVFPVRVLFQMGIRAVILTNVAGGIHPEYQKGCLVALRDHINLQGTNPLIGPNEERFGVRFPDLTEVYSARYRQAAVEQARRLGIVLHEGVYAGLTGPSYETPAEVRSLRSMGADLVGMSTVPEAIAAAHLGMSVLGISCVTNMAAGLSEDPLSAEDVLETVTLVKADFTALVRAMIPRIDEELRGQLREEIR